MSFGLKLKTLPDSYKKLLAPEDRKALGKDGLLSEEVIARGRVKLERDLRKHVLNLLRLRGIVPISARDDKKSTISVGLPDIMFAVKTPEQRPTASEIVGSCTCGTKTPEVKYHAESCRYRQIMERKPKPATASEQGAVEQFIVRLEEQLWHDGQMTNAMREHIRFLIREAQRPTPATASEDFSKSGLSAGATQTWREASDKPDSAAASEIVPAGEVEGKYHGQFDMKPDSASTGTSPLALRTVACAWELKLPGGKLDPEQVKTAARLSAPPNEWKWALITTVDEAIAELAAIGLEP